MGIINLFGLVDDVVYNSMTFEQACVFLVIGASLLVGLIVSIRSN